MFCKLCGKDKKITEFYKRDKLCKMCRRGKGRHERWKKRLKKIKGAKSHKIRSL